MAKARDYWIFSYLRQGMNMKDIASLKWKNLKDDKLEFIREKTKRTKKSEIKTIIVYLTPEAIDIIERWGTDNKKADNYIFRILDESMSEERKLRVKNQAIKVVNDWMKKIAKELEFDVSPTMYYARHSYSTILRNSGASLEYISKALGHKDLVTTEKYLDSFEEEKARAFNEKLLSTGNRDLKVSHKAG